MNFIRNERCSIICGHTSREVRGMQGFIAQYCVRTRFHAFSASIMQALRRAALISMKVTCVARWNVDLLEIAKIISYIFVVP